jgi:hypothetical protein
MTETKRIILQVAIVDGGRTDQVIHQPRSLFSQNQNNSPHFATLIGA